MQFSCEIHGRLRDLNLARHVDNVAAMRLLDEGRHLFFGARGVPEVVDLPGVLVGIEDEVTILVAGQRVEYRAEFRVNPAKPFLLTMWIGHLGASSFTVDTELRTGPDASPAAGHSNNQCRSIQGNCTIKSA